MSVTPWATGELFNRITLNQRIEETNNDVQAAIQEAIEEAVNEAPKIVTGVRLGNGTSQVVIQFDTVPQFVYYRSDNSANGEFIAIGTSGTSGGAPYIISGTTLTINTSTGGFNNNQVYYYYFAVCK